MLMIDFINVGYGDAILIREQENDGKTYNMLIDCGDVTAGPYDPKSKRIKAVDFLKKNGIGKLDLLVLSHLHLDHSGGLPDIVGSIQISEFWVNYLPDKNDWANEIAANGEFSSGGKCLLTALNLYCRSLTCMAKNGTKIRLINQQHGTRMMCGGRLHVAYSSGDDYLQRRQDEIFKNALHGLASKAELDELDRFINNTSIRLRIAYGDKTLELPGDISAAAWETMVSKPCTIVKLPHHGHKDSLSETLLSKLSPEHAVISVCNYRQDDCPSKGIIEMLKRRHISFSFTDAVACDKEPLSYHDSVQFVLPSE